MADHGKHEEAAAPAGDGNAKPSGGSIVPWIAVGVLSAGMGSALPFLLSGQQSHAAASTEEHGETEHGDAGHGDTEHGTKTEGSEKSDGKKNKAFTMTREEDTIFMPFGEPGKDQSVVVNLDEGRMSRYLRVAITLQIPKSQEETFKKQIEAKKIVLRNWLLSKISDLDLDDIRGAAGQNRLRREIREQFNAVLCPDGYDQIYDVLFEEFNVQ
jgi:flagellar FliL protein